MNGNIPTLAVSGHTLPEAWEKAVLACWHEGVPIKTEYDKPGDPPSRDCTMLWTVEDPFAEPTLRATVSVLQATTICAVQPPVARPIRKASSTAL